LPSEDWQDRADRVLANERDTAFHVAMSDRPRVDEVGTERDLSIHPLRLSFDDFDVFLNALQDDTGGAIPSVWCAARRTRT